MAAVRGAWREWAEGMPQRTDFTRATAAVRGIYRQAGLATPQVRFARSPVAARQLESQLRAEGHPYVMDQVRAAILGLNRTLRRNMSFRFIYPALLALMPDWESPEDRWLQPYRELSDPTRQLYWRRYTFLARSTGSAIDYTVARRLGVEFDSRTFGLFCELYRNCFLLLPFEEVCVVGERPVSVAHDPVWGISREHGPALRFADGHRVWVRQGVVLYKP